MAEKTKTMKVANDLGCGFVGRIFLLKTNKLRNSSVHSLPITQKQNSDQKPARKSISGHRRPISDVARTSTSSSSSSSVNSANTKSNHHENRLIQREPNPLESMKLTGNLLANNNNSPRIIKRMGSKDMNFITNSSSYSKNAVMGNIMRRNSDEFGQFRSPKKNRVDDAEVLKNMGNEAYKQGKFKEAMGLYDRAIQIDSTKATYYCNKSAALMGLGRLLQALIECQEAIRLDPSYNRAHTRLATIYLRMGEAEKAMNCNSATSNGESVLGFQAQALQNHLHKCIEFRKVNQWNAILKETQSVISLGVDSAPQVYALQTEALLKLLKHQEAYSTYEKMPKFELDWCTKLFGLPITAYMLMIGAQVHLAAGRFEDAVMAAQQAVELDPSNKEVSGMLRRSRAVRSARLSGNLLFKASKFMEACGVYNEGLEHDPFNPVLLCNRAACRSKLGQFEKAIEDCNAALKVQPYYSKARLRRADCNAKLERWEVAIQDYEMLLRETPGDEEVARALFEAQLQLKMLRGEDIKDLKFGSNLVSISSNDRFRHYVTSPGMSVVLFCNKTTHKQVLLVLEQTCKRFPSVHFLKVEIEDHPYLAKSEGVSSVPAFRIYKNGSRVKEIPGNKHQMLETSVKLYTS